MVTVAPTIALRMVKGSGEEVPRSQTRNAGRGREAKTESRTTFSGHGAARLMAVSISIARMTAVSHFQ